MLLRLFLCSVISNVTLCQLHNYAVDFDSSMGKHDPFFDHYYQEGLNTEQARSVLEHLKLLYQKNMPSNITPQALPKIPKIIHQIWLGSPIPEKFKQYQITWQHHHPDWEYKLWTDNDIAQLHLENQQAYDLAINYAERSDIARYEILYRFGGLYVDTDCQCIQSFDELHHCYDFYAGIEFPAMAMFLCPIIIPNALIGSCAGHQIMRTCIDMITAKIKTNSQESDIVVKTGPVLFTTAILSIIQKASSTTDIIFPATFFYPIDKKIKDKALIQKCIKPETFAIHHWAGSWILKEEAFVPGIKIKCRQEGNVLKFSIIDERKS